jgi:putative intracellular protease/amidase
MSLKDPNSVNPKAPKRIAIVIANPATATISGWPCGFWWSELTHTYYTFSEHGYHVEVFSPDGGKCEPDALSDPCDPSGYSSTDLITMGFISMPHLAKLIDNTKSVEGLDVDAFDVIVVAAAKRRCSGTTERRHSNACGVLRKGQGRVRPVPRRLAAAVYEVEERPVLGRQTVTGFANVEEDYADNAVWTMNLLPRDKHVMPWRIEDEVKKLGANYVQAGLWQGFATGWVGQLRRN